MVVISIYSNNIQTYHIIVCCHLHRSMSGKVEIHAKDDSEPPHTFIKRGQNYHIIRRLLPESGQKLGIAQMCVYYTCNERKHKLSHFFM